LEKLFIRVSELLGEVHSLRIKAWVVLHKREAVDHGIFRGGEEFLESFVRPWLSCCLIGC